MHDFQICWIDSIYDRFPNIPYQLTSILIAISCYLTAITPLLLIRELYLATAWPLVLGAIGIAWVCGSCRWATKTYGTVLDKVSSIIDPDFSETFIKHKSETFDKMACRDLHVRPALIIWGIFSVVLVLSWLGVVRHEYVSYVFFMPSRWYRPHLIAWRLATVIMFALPIILVIYTTGRMLILHTMLVCRIANLKFQPSARLCLRLSRPMLNFGIVASMTWSVGVGFFAILYQPELDFFRMAILATLGGVGALGFIIPVIRLRKKLFAMRDQRTEALIRFLAQKLESIKVPPADPSLLIELYQLEEQIELNSRMDSMFVGWQYVLWTLSSVVTPLLIAVVQARLQL